MIKLTYYYSACVGIETSDTNILCDPWFTEGIYDGSWYHYPKFENALEILPAYHYIYVSHIHPDHYDSSFLKKYLAKHPETKILIAPFQNNFLAKKMQSDQIQSEIISELKIGETVFSLIPQQGELDIDSALVVKWQNQSIVNMNDNPFNEKQVQEIRTAAGGDPTIALVGYTGAGPYPQTYYTDTETLKLKAQEKKEDFFQRYRRTVKALNPQITIPFAGKYILGSHLYTLNEYRGVSDAVEVLQFDPKAVVLADGGKAWIDTVNLKPSAVRTKPYDLKAMGTYAKSLAKNKLDYERYFSALELKVVPLKRLLAQAYRRATNLSPCKENYYFCIPVPDGEWFVMNAKRESKEGSFTKSIDAFTPRSEIKVDPHYLFGLLTGVFHWNNAEVGSLYRVNRVPDAYSADAQLFMSFLSVV